MSNRAERKAEIEDFLFLEAELLDSWKLKEWSDLYSDESHYEVASLSASRPWDADPHSSIFLIADDKEQINLRAERLLKDSAHCEFPHSKTRHLVSNIRAEEDGPLIRAKANFVTYRTKDGRTSRYMGEAHYILERSDDAFKIRNKRCVLDLETLNDQGRLTIIL